MSQSAQCRVEEKRQGLPPSGQTFTLPLAMLHRGFEGSVTRDFSALPTRSRSCSTSSLSLVPLEDARIALALEQRQISFSVKFCGMPTGS
jgi:hypothetical protein